MTRMLVALAIVVWIGLVAVHLRQATEDLTIPIGTVEATSEKQQLILDRLMLEFPCGYEVKLLAFSDPRTDVWGWTTWRKESQTYEIHIYSPAPLAMVAETIMHEYAHVLVWDAIKASDHGGVYWAAYGNLYRFSIGE